MSDQFQDRVPVFDPEEGLDIAEGSIDESAGIIRGVSIATANVEAIGHGEYNEEGVLLREFWTDGETLESMLQACLAVGEPVKAKLEHGSGLIETVGTFGNFRIDGEHLRADFQSFDTSPSKDHLFAVSKRIAKQFGVSVHALLAKARGASVDLMRVRKIFSIDFVDEPAINAALFSSKKRVDNPRSLQQQRKQNTNTTMDEELKKEVTELVSAAMKPVTDKLSELEGMIPAKTEEEMSAEQKAEAEAKEKLENQEKEMKALREEVTNLSKGLVEAKTEAKKLGTELAARTHADAPGGDAEKTFESEMTAKRNSGKPDHEAFNELCSENMDLVRLEAKKQGKAVWQLI